MSLEKIKQENGKSPAIYNITQRSQERSFIHVKSWMIKLSAMWKSGGRALQGKASIQAVMTDWTWLICKTERKGVWLEARVRERGLGERVRKEARALPLVRTLLSLMLAWRPPERRQLTQTTGIRIFLGILHINYYFIIFSDFL